MNAITKTATLALITHFVIMAAGCHPYSSRGYERSDRPYMDRTQDQDADSILKMQALQVGLGLAKGFYYITSGGNGLDVDTGKVTAASDGTILVVAILDSSEFFCLLSGGGQNGQAKITSNENPSYFKYIDVGEFTEATYGQGSSITLTKPDDFDQNHDLYELVQEMIASAGAQNPPIPVPVP